MTNKLVVTINSLKVPKIKKILLYEMKFLVSNYSCLQNPWLGGYRPQIPVLSVLNWICWTPPRKKFLGTPLMPVSYTRFEPRNSRLWHCTKHASHCVCYSFICYKLITHFRRLMFISRTWREFIEITHIYRVEASWNVMAHAQKQFLVFRRNGRVHLNRPRGRRFSRLLAAEVCASAVVMLDTPCSEVVWRLLATQCIRQFPPSLPLPCVAVCHHISTGLYRLTTDKAPWIHSTDCKP